jgi:hypothetical protein
MDKKLLQPVFKKWRVELPVGEWTPNPETDDFGNEIKSLLLAAETNEKMLSLPKSSVVSTPIWEGISFLHTPKNLKTISSQLGIAIVEANSFYYVRDSFIRLASGEIRTTRLSNVLEDAMERAHSSNLYLDKAPTTRTRNQLFNHWSGFGSRYSLQTQTDIEKLFPKNQRSFQYTYAEGGNVFTLTNGKGEVHVFVGEDHRTQTFLILEQEKLNWAHLAAEAGLMAPFSNLVNEMASTLSDSQVFTACEEMYSLGLLASQGQTGLIDPKIQLNILLSKFFMASSDGKKDLAGEQGWFHSLATRGGFIKPFLIGDDKKGIARSIAGEYLIKQKIVHALIAKDFNVSEERLHFIAQANYHLDAFMAPGPQHSIFLNSYAFCADLLQGLINARLALGISENDIAILEGYLETAKKLDLELEALLRTAENQLKAAGFNVIPMPGHFLYEPVDMYEKFPIPSEGLCINFVNSIEGWSLKASSYYYVTHGLHVGEQVGQLLMESFSCFLESYIDPIAVYFVGYDPGHPADFSEALDFWNRIETQSGVHCVTFSL